MKKRFILITLCLSAFVATFTIAWKSSNWSQTEISYSNIDSIIMIRSMKADTMMSDSRKLSDAQVKQFTEDWNDAKSVGPCKYISLYHLTVYLKGGTKRDFRANGKTIKEKTDYGFNMKQEDYFGKLWESAK